VLELLLAGLQTHQIADRLFISRETVRTHVAAIMRKFGVSKREELLSLLRRR
jgi:DNA-binding CsgD family transcriptional regulator